MNFRELQFLNILFILTRLGVLKLLKFNEVSEWHSKNILDIEITLVVSKFSTFNEVSFLQP